MNLPWTCMKALWTQTEQLETLCKVVESFVWTCYSLASLLNCHLKNFPDCFWNTKMQEAQNKWQNIPNLAKWKIRLVLLASCSKASLWFFNCFRCCSINFFSISHSLLHFGYNHLKVSASRFQTHTKESDRNSYYSISKVWILKVWISKVRI